MSEIKRIMGIDPGFKGGIACRDIGGGNVSTYPMPTLTEYFQKDNKTKDRAVLDRAEIVNIMKKEKPDVVIIEKVASRPGQGAPATFRFGEQFGILQGIAWGLGIPVATMIPQVWQARILVGNYRKRAHEDVKKAVQRYCEDHYHIAVLSVDKKKQKIHDGICDALCIAEAIEKR